MLWVHCVPCFSLMDANILHKHKSVYSSLCNFLHPSAISVALGPDILHSKCSPAPSIYVFPLGEGSYFLPMYDSGQNHGIVYCLIGVCLDIQYIHFSASEGVFVDECFDLWMTETCYVLHGV
jgi:hypothetical protein